MRLMMCIINYYLKNRVDKKSCDILTTMKQTLKFCVVLFLAATYSCSQSQNLSETPSDTMSEKSVDTNKTEITEENTTVERKIIKKGEITFETKNSTETRAIITKNISELKGYVSEDNIFDYKDKIQYRITIRVPAGNFELLLDRISQNVAKIDNKNVNTLDVTEEFIDVEARIKTKKEIENRYKELLKQANKVEEILAIEKEIGSLRTEIESVEGRLKYLEDKISYSTLTVVFYEKTSSPFGFNSKMGQALKSGWTNLLWFFVALTNLWPFIIIGLATIFIYKRYKKNKKKNNV